MQEKQALSRESHELVGKIVDFFIKESERSRGKICDPFGTVPLKYLAGVLERTDADSFHWDKIANFVLDRAPVGSHFFFSKILLTISERLSEEARMRVFSHFVNHGDIDNALSIAVSQLHRSPTAPELITMAKVHHKIGTLSNDAVWEKLIDISMGLSDDKTTSFMKKLIEEIQYNERFSGSC